MKTSGGQLTGCPSCLMFACGDDDQEAAPEERVVITPLFFGGEDFPLREKQLKGGHIRNSADQQLIQRERLDSIPSIDDLPDGSISELGGASLVNEFARISKRANFILLSSAPG